MVREGGRFRGVEAVIDKDLTAALLAESLGAERLVLVTDVPYAMQGFGTRTERPIEAATPAELRRMHFAAGSMAPKVEAACRFVERTGGTCAIGSLFELSSVARGTAGTQVGAPWTVPLRSSRHPDCAQMPMIDAVRVASVGDEVP